MIGYQFGSSSVGPQGDMCQVILLDGRQSKAMNSLTPDKVTEMLPDVMWFYQLKWLDFNRISSKNIYKGLIDGMNMISLVFIARPDWIDRHDIKISSHENHHIGPPCG